MEGLPPGFQKRAAWEALFVHELEDFDFVELILLDVVVPHRNRADKVKVLGRLLHFLEVHFENLGFPVLYMIRQTACPLGISRR